VVSLGEKQDAEPGRPKKKPRLGEANIGKGRVVCVFFFFLEN